MNAPPSPLPRPAQFRRGLATLLLLALTLPLLAHDPGLSTATARLQPDGLDIELVLSIKDAATIVNADHNRDGHLTREEIAAAETALALRAYDAFHITWNNSTASVALATCHIDGQDNATFYIEATGVPHGRLRVQSRWFTRLSAGHRLFLTVQNAAGDTLTEQLLSAASDTVTLDIPRPAAASKTPSNPVASKAPRAGTLTPIATATPTKPGAPTTPTGPLR